MRRIVLGLATLLAPILSLAQTTTVDLGWTGSQYVNVTWSPQNYYFKNSSAFQPPAPLSVSSSGTVEFEVDVYWAGTQNQTPVASGSVTVWWQNLANASAQTHAVGATATADGSSDSVSYTASASGANGSQSGSNTNGPTGIQTTIQGSQLTWTWDSVREVWVGTYVVHTVDLASCASVNVVGPAQASGTGEVDTLGTYGIKSTSIMVG